MKASKTLFIALITIMPAFNASAELPYVNVKNFKADYINPEGSASADEFAYMDQDFGNNPEFDIYQQAGEFVLTTPGDEFRISSLPAAVYDWKSVKVEKLDVSSNSDFFNLESQRIDYVSADNKSGSIGGLKMECETTSKGIMESFLDMCLNQKMYFYLPSVSGVGINSVNVWTHNNTFEFSLKKVVWIKGDGAIFYEPENKLIRIRVDRAKAGFFSVRGKLFDALEGMENRFMTVNEPWIEIKTP